VKRVGFLNFGTKIPKVLRYGEYLTKDKSGQLVLFTVRCPYGSYRGADKSLARPGRKQTTATEDFDVLISYLLSYLEEY